jgi:O-antigen/teichoic acid export membrane protein
MTVASSTGSPAATTAPSLASPAIRGSVWTMGGYAAGQLLRLASNIVLTRLLYPAAFGEMALVFSLMAGLQMFSDVGTGPAIVQNPRGSEAPFLNTAWTIQCVRGGLLWLASWLIAWPVAAYYQDPMLRWLIPAAGSTALIGGFTSTSVHTLERHLRLERLTIIDLASQFLGIVVTVLAALADCAVYGPNHPSAVWAIVSGTVIGVAARVVLSHTHLPGVRNRFHVDRQAMTVLFNFGRWIFISTLLTFLSGQSDRLIFGKMIPLALFGVYSIASMLAALPTQAMLRLGSAVIFPAYSRLVGREDFKRVFWRARLPLLLAGGAMVSALLACGPFLVRVLYDRRYEEAGWVLQYLAAGAWFQILECTNGAALLAKGNVKWVAAGSAAKVLGMVVAIPLGVCVGGFHGAVAGLVASDLLKYLISAGVTAAAGLNGFGRDLLLTAGIVVLSAAGFASGSPLARRFPGNMAALFAAAATAGLPWVVLGLWHLRRDKAVRAAVAGCTYSAG